MESACCTTTEHEAPQTTTELGAKAAIVVLSDPQSGSDEALG